VTSFGTVLASPEGFDSKGLQRDMIYFVLPSSREIGYLYIVQLLIWGIDCCKLLHASYGSPKCRVMKRQCSVIGGLLPRLSGIKRVIEKCLRDSCAETRGNC
jgi:hypothetical protein